MYQQNKKSMQSTANIEQVILRNLRSLTIEKLQEVLEFTERLRQTFTTELPTSKLSLCEIAAMPLTERHQHIAPFIVKTTNDFLNEPELTEFSVLDTEDWETEFSFLGDYDMNDNKLFSRTHIDFLHEFSMYSSRNPKDSLIKMRVALKEKRTVVAVDIIKNMIRTNASGFTSDLFITKFYLDILNGQQIDIFNAVYDSSYTTQPYFLNIINEEYANLKKFLSNKNTDGAKLTSLKTSITTQLIDSIAAKYKNKVIYIDFWAPWCGPCMNEMPFTKEIQEYFKNEKVVFLFLASRCKEDSWKSTIVNKKLTGEHILLTDDQFNILSSILGINGIPHYSLIDKRGNINLKNAPRPSDKIELKNEIEKLLKNK